VNLLTVVPEFLLRDVLRHGGLVADRDVAK
jgi:hypothetical protein